MRAAIFRRPHSIEVIDRPDPVIIESAGMVVRVVLSCVCGCDNQALARRDEGLRTLESKANAMKSVRRYQYA